jgi:hypothetical protein
MHSDCDVNELRERSFAIVKPPTGHELSSLCRQLISVAVAIGRISGTINAAMLAVVTLPGAAAVATTMSRTIDSFCVNTPASVSLHYTNVLT